MRLGQLSRKISVRPAEIAAFLAAKGIAIEDNTNTRIPDDVALMVASHFAPGLKFDVIIQEETRESPPVEIESAPIEPAPEPLQEPLEIPAPKTTSTSEEISSIVEEASPLVPEVIKAPKVELQGLKVVGKIELPQPKKKEALPPSEEEKIEPTAPIVERKGRDERKPRHSENQNSRPRKNPIAMKREREAREAEELKRAELEKEKEKRTKYYMQRVKTVAPQRRANIVDEPLSQLQDEAPDEPKTLWGKFVKWLTSH